MGLSQVPNTRVWGVACRSTDRLASCELGAQYHAMPANDLRTRAKPFHLLSASVYTPAQNTVSLDLAGYEGGAILTVNVLSVATSPAVFTLQDSDDNVSFADVSGKSETLGVGTYDDSFSVYVHARDGRRYVRLRKTGGAVTGFGVNAVAYRDTQGEPAHAFEIDSTT